MEKETQEHNILITTLGYTEDHLHPEYYRFEDTHGDIKFCDGISGAEAGTKLILSRNSIDEILVIGSPNAAGGKYPKEACPISSLAALQNIDIEKTSEFDFFCYRLQQYFDRIDIEANDILNYTTVEKRNELKKLLNEKLKKGPHGLFYSAATDSDAYDAYLKVISDMTDEKQIRWLKHMMYIDMDSSYKMYPLELNSNVKIRFIPVEKNEQGSFSVENMVHVVNTLSEESGELNVHIDLQGMDKADSYTIWSMLAIASSSNTKLKLRTMIRSRVSAGSFINSIDNEIQRYDIEMLLSGMRAFIQYGKVELLEEYCASHKIKDTYIMNFINAMKYVDTGVSLCNLSDLEYGIQALKKIFSNMSAESFGNEEGHLFSILKRGIKDDYGALLEGTDVNIPELINWALRKHFYQQALTIIESLVPADMVKRGLYYYAKDQADVEDQLKNWNVLYWNELPRNRYTFNDPDHYFIKFYGRSIINFRQAKDQVARDYAKQRIEQLSGKHPELSKAYSGVSDTDTLYELLLCYYNIGDIRNQVSHALTSEHALSGQEEMKDNKSFDILKCVITRFLSLYRSACSKVDLQGTAPQLIDDALLHGYTINHRLQPLEVSDENLLLSNTYDCQFNGQDISINIRMLKPQDDNG